MPRAPTCGLGSVLRLPPSSKRRPSFISEKEEDVIAHYMAFWTRGGNIFTCGDASVLLRQYIGDVGRVEEAELRFGRGGMPCRSYFVNFFCVATRSSVG